MKKKTKKTALVKIGPRLGLASILTKSVFQFFQFSRNVGIFLYVGKNEKPRKSVFLGKYWKTPEKQPSLRSIDPKQRPKNTLRPE